MSNTFERLRDAASYEFTPHAVASLYTKAADEIDRLTAEVGKWRRQDAMHMGELRDLHKQLAEKDKRIEGLERILDDAIGIDNVSFAKEQIDEMWRHTRPKGISAADQFFADGALAAIAEADIVACEECGGSGVEDGMTVMAFCHDCGSHGWVKK